MTNEEILRSMWRKQMDDAYTFAQLMARRKQPEDANND